MLNVISWNIDQYTQKKLNRELTLHFKFKDNIYVIKENVMNYILGVLKGADDFEPADIIIIVELMGGTGGIGSNASSTATSSLSLLATGLNEDLGKTFDYQVVSPLTIGNGEAMGVIYNAKKLTYKDKGVQSLMGDTRAVFWSTFEPTAASGINDKTNSLTVVGVHAPKPPKTLKTINYCQALNTVPQIKDVKTTDKQLGIVMGDFNISPTSNVSGKKPFATLASLKYKTQLTVKSKTTIKDPSTITSIDDYLGNPVDNLFMLAPSSVTNKTNVIDLIKDTIAVDTLNEVKLVVKQLRGTGTRFSAPVSDHLPVYATIS